MITSRLAITAIAALLCACATRPPMFQGTWYLQAADGETNPTLYIAILNRGAEDLKVRGLVLNSPGGRTAEGWGLEIKSPVTLAPGAMLVRKAKDFERKTGVAWPECHLPLDVVILLTNGEAEISLAGPMPSALPGGWEACPASN